MFQRARVLRHCLAFCNLRNLPQQPANNLTAACLGQVVAEADVPRLGDRSDFLGNPVAQLVRDLLRLFAGGPGSLEHDEGADRFACRFIGPAHHRRFSDNLPKTRSGKIMRRLLRNIAMGEAITQDTSTLENPGILDQLSEKQ